MVETPSAVLVTGATGAVGPALVAELARSGATVRVLCRRPPPPGLLPATVEVRVGDVLRPEDVADAMRRISQVFHLASRLHIANPDPSLRDDYEAVNVGGTRHILEAIANIETDTAGVDFETRKCRFLGEQSPASAMSFDTITTRRIQQFFGKPARRI